jgi:hypothetical protein
MRRPLLVLVAAISLTACGTTVSETFTDVGDIVVTPSPAATDGGSSATPAADAPTITLEPGVVADGPGETIEAAIAAARSEPTLVNGILLKDLDGRIWLCSSLLESSPPQCGEPRLLVVNFPAEAADFDPESAELTGLQEDGGVFWLEGHQLFGVVEP